MSEVKLCYVLACASDVILMHCKQIQSYVGALKLYLVTKDMKLDNAEVSTIKFIGDVPHADIRE